MTYNKDSAINQRRAIKISAIILAVVLVVVLGLFGFCKATLGTDKIYSGISVLGLELGGLTEDEAERLISEKFAIDTAQTITLSCEGSSLSFPVSEIEPVLDAAATAHEVYAYARYGSVLDRVRAVWELKTNSIEIPASVTFNEEAFYVHTDKLTMDTGIPMEDISAELSGDTLIITPGKPGLEINRETAAALVCEGLAKKNYNISLSLEETVPAEPTAEELYNRFYADAKDATYELADNEIKYTDAVTGIHFDKATAKKAIESADGDTISLAVTVIEPDVTVDELKEKMFRDRLATYSSKYNEGVVGRSYNVKLASQFINGTILMPGDVFSYNDVVGPRTLARGFKEANVYVGSEVEVGVGGGICQVSSTLFNSVVMSGLTIESRTSHSLPVSYVPPGRDATVSYGSIDFKFSNPYDMPVKIVATASGGVNTVAIYGTNNNPSRKISFETELIRTVPYSTKQTEDPSLPEGEIKIETRGANGSSYNTYKVITENGAVISRTLLTKSNYNATTQKELIGTAPVAAENANAEVSGEAAGETENSEATDTPENAQPSAEPTATPTVAPGAETKTEVQPTAEELPSEGDAPTIVPVSPSVE